MADITYYEDGYIAQGYHVYTADAVIGLQPYLAEDYIIRDYFESRGVESLLVADLTRSEFIEFAAALAAVATTSILAGRLESATVAMTCTASMTTVAVSTLSAASDLTSNFTQTTTANRDRRTSVTLSSIANVSAQADDRLRDQSAAFSSQFTQSASAAANKSITQNITAEATATATATRISEFSSNFASIATQLTVAFQNATGTILLEPRFTVSALVGVIKQGDTGSLFGASFPGDSRHLVYTDSTRLPQGVSQGNFLSVWFRIRGSDQLGSILISDNPNNTGALGLGYDSTSILLTSFAETAPNTSVALIWPNTRPQNDQWHHMAVALLSWDGTFPGNFLGRLYIDGQGYNDSDTGSLTYNHVQSWFDNLRIGTNASVDLAQLWIGDRVGLNSSNAADYLANFYDGAYRDLGSGQVDGTPYIVYEPLAAPFTARTTASSGSITDFYGTEPLRGIIARASITASILGVLVNNSNMVSTTALTIQPGYLITSTATLTSTATVQCQAVKTARADAVLATASALTAVSEAVRSYQVAVSAHAALACVVLKLTEFNSNLNTAFTLAAAVNETTELAATLVSTSTLSVAYTRTRSSAGNLAAQLQIATAIDHRLRDQSATLATTLSVICDARTIEGVDSLMASQFTITVNTEVVKVAQALLTSQFTQSAQAFRVAVAQAQLQVQAFELTQGDVINFAPELIYRVPAESRSRRVLPENRVYDCDSESRTRRVLPETRVLSIAQETELNII